VLPLPESKRTAGRRIAEALLDPLVRGVRVVSSRGAAGATASPAAAPMPAPVPAPEPAAPAEVPPEVVSGDDAAARIDAARARLRAKIAPPADDDPA
jgi:hypothetical protein